MLNYGSVITNLEHANVIRDCEPAPIFRKAGTSSFFIFPTKASREKRTRMKTEEEKRKQRERRTKGKAGGLSIKMMH
jgi:hypothetical protein